MLHSIPWKNYTQQLRDSCDSFDHLWIKRRRVFDTFAMVSSLLDLVAGSDKSYLSVMHNFEQDYSTVPASSSFCEARKKLPSYVLSEINDDLFDGMTELTEPADWFGLTPYAVDGTKVTVPKNLSKQGFHIQKGTYFPMGLVSGLIRISDRSVKKLTLSSNLNERDFAHEILEEMSETDLLIYDRGYLSFALLSEHISRGVGSVFRVSANNSFRELEDFWESHDTDAVVQVDPTDTTYRTARRTCPDIMHGPVEVRLIKYKMGTKSYMLATTILDMNIPAKAFIALYSKRWKIEEFFKTFKITMDAENFHSNHKNGIEQEVHASALLWNISRALDILTTTLKKAF